MGLVHLVSSANRSVLEEVVVAGRSLMNMMNSSGPRTLPWGTSEETGRKLECWLLMVTYCEQLER